MDIIIVCYNRQISEFGKFIDRYDNRYISFIEVSLRWQGVAQFIEF